MSSGCGCKEVYRFLHIYYMAKNLISQHSCIYIHILDTAFAVQSRNTIFWQYVVSILKPQ